MTSGAAFTTVETRLRKLSDPLLFAIGLAVIVGVAALDVRTTHTVPVQDFYLMPVLAVGWLTRSAWYGVAAAILAGVVGVTAEVTYEGSHDLALQLLAGAVRVVLYLFLLWLLAAVRTVLAERGKLALTDDLTGVANTRSFAAAASAEIERSRRFRHQLSLLYADIDDFKAINDRLGHAEGDRVLRAIADTMTSALRTVDTVARLGGDEFVVLMPETGADAAKLIARRIKKRISGVVAADGAAVTCSFGLITFRKAPASLEELMREADRLMYAAKVTGKDALQQAVA